MTTHTYAGHTLAEIKAAAEAATPAAWLISIDRNEPYPTSISEKSLVERHCIYRSKSMDSWPLYFDNTATVLAMAARIEELEREKAEVEAIAGDTLIKMDELSAKVNGLEKDSARYRFLRDHEDPESIDGPARDMARSMLLDSRETDKSIDAAMEQTKNREGA